MPAWMHPFRTQMYKVQAQDSGSLTFELPITATTVTKKTEYIEVSNNLYNVLLRRATLNGENVIYLQCFIENLAAFDCLLDTTANVIRIWAPALTDLTAGSWTVFV